MYKFFKADYILPVNGLPIKNGVVSVNEQGEILGLHHPDERELENKEIEKHQGIITPGFVNSHCHLELSHLKSTIPKKEGLVSFIKNVLFHRKAEDDIILKAIENADDLMYKNGIVAVGDISNTSSSKSTKKNSNIYYHTFIELMGFDPSKSTEKFNEGLALKDDFAHLPNSIVPHSSYSVSKELFNNISNYAKEIKNLVSIHSQESEEENKLFRYKTGQFVDLFKSLNINIDFFKPQGRNSLQSILSLLPKNQKILLVHNTYTSVKDIYFLNRMERDITWCFCPNANLYIENSLPKLDLFLNHSFNITLGTDSLASNNTLCILAEIKTLSKHFPSLPLTTSIAWATLNGARFLGIDKRYGSIEKGKTPGLNLITETKGLEITSQSQVKKLI